jgi:outer membrane protein assembly factor BamB
MTDQCAFSVIDHQLLIVETRTGRVRWHGKPLGRPVEEVEGIPGAPRAVVLLDYMAGPPGPAENLVCVDCDGQVAWRARLPTDSSTDAYVSFELVGGQLVAHSWSGHRVVIDPATGDVRDSKFTK